MLSRRAFLYVAGVSLARAQDTQFSTSVNVVNVLATVSDKQGKIIHDLAQDEFTLQEDGRPQTIRYFSQQSDLPLTLGLLLDTSGSQTRVLDRERNASYEFFEHILREDKDKAFLIHFDREVELLQDLTSSRKDLEAALRDAASSDRPQLNRRTPGTSPSPGGGGGRGQGRGGGGGTAMYDSIFLAADEILKKQQGRKAVVLLSDGVDRGSKTTIGGAIESAQRADMLVYSIRFADDSDRNPAGFGGPGIGRGGRRGGSRSLKRNGLSQSMAKRSCNASRRKPEAPTSMCRTKCLSTRSTIRSKRNCATSTASVTHPTNPAAAITKSWFR